MKTCLFFVKFIFILFIGLFIEGCASNNFVYDRSVEEENTCILKIPDDFTVVKFDDKNVKWKTSFWRLSIVPKKGEAIVKIPAGEHKLIVNYLRVVDFGSYREISRADGIELSFDFQPGITYALFPMIGRDRISVNIIRDGLFNRF